MTERRVRTYVKTLTSGHIGALLGSGDGEVAVALFDEPKSWIKVPTEQFCVQCVCVVPPLPGGFVSTECPLCHKGLHVRQMLAAHNPITIASSEIQMVTTIRWAVLDGDCGYPSELWRLDPCGDNGRKKLLYVLESSCCARVSKDGAVHEFFLARKIKWNEQGTIAYEAYTSDSCIEQACVVDAIALFPKELQM